MEKEKAKTIKAHCNKCKLETNHFVRAKYDQDWDLGFTDRAWCKNRIIECCGCEAIRFMKVDLSTYDIEDYYDEDGNYQTRFNEMTTYYPENELREMPKWAGAIKNDEPELHELYSELYAVLRTNLTRLAGMASRATLEQILNKMVGEFGTFDQRLEKLKTENHVSQSELETLKTAVDLGNAANHRGWKPTTDELNTVLDIIENLMHRIYILTQNAKKVQEKIPPRAKKTDV